MLHCTILSSEPILLVFPFTYTFYVLTIHPGSCLS